MPYGTMDLEGPTIESPSPSFAVIVIVNAYYPFGGMDIAFAVPQIEVSFVNYSTSLHERLAENHKGNHENTK